MKSKNKLNYITRNCKKEDLRKLEWDEELSQFRNLYESTFAKAENGEIIMIVVDLDNFPVGQIWIDLVKKKKESIGILYALRVMEKYQRQGIGTALIKEAEQILKDKNYKICEMSVGKTNPLAKKLYERLEYKIIKEEIGLWSYKNQAGKTIKISEPELVLNKIIE